MLILPPTSVCQRKNKANAECSTVYLHFTLNFAALLALLPKPTRVVLPKQKICQLLESYGAKRATLLFIATFCFTLVSTAVRKQAANALGPV
jgi:hypothetical protein